MLHRLLLLLRSRLFLRPLLLLRQLRVSTTGSRLVQGPLQIDGDNLPRITEARNEHLQKRDGDIRFVFDRITDGSVSQLDLQRRSHIDQLPSLIVDLLSVKMRGFSPLFELTLFLFLGASSEFHIPQLQRRVNGRQMRSR